MPLLQLCTTLALLGLGFGLVEGSFGEDFEDVVALRLRVQQHLTAGDKRPHLNPFLLQIWDQFVNSKQPTFS